MQFWIARLLHPYRRPYPSGLLAATAIALAIAATRCTNSSTLVDPSPVKCPVTVAPQNTAVDANGGKVTVKVTVDPECAWSVSTTQSWISIVSTSGQGTGEADFRVAPNSSSSARHGQVAVNSQHVEVDQAGCAFSLAESGRNVPPSGSSETVAVTGGSACGWTAVSNADWITITAGASGTGSGNVGFTVAPNSGTSRSATLTIGGQTFTVTQTSVGAGCPAVITPTAQAFSSGGGSANVSVTVAADCTWTAVSNAAWITVVSGGTGTGNGSVTINVTTSNTPRTGTVTIAGQTLTVTQSTGCTYTLSPASQSLPSNAGSSAVDVSAPSSCPWTASSGADWITITAGASGSGNGRVVFSVSANSGGTRNGGLTIAGQAATVTQAGGCAGSLSRASDSVGAAGGAGNPIGVTIGAGCSWTASSNASWITITGGASGVGPGTVTFNVASSTGPQRTGTLTIAAVTFTLTQASGCTYSISPTSGSVGSGAGPAPDVGVTTAAGCTWTAGSNAGWITIISGATGTGPGTVKSVVAPNIGVQRTGTLTIAGQTFTLTQASGCTFLISPTTGSVGSGSGPAPDIGVTTAAGCTWTAVSNAPWITITSGASGTGPGTVKSTVAANTTGAQRIGTLTVAGQTFTLTQAR